jgi:cytochrome b
MARTPARLEVDRRCGDRRSDRLGYQTAALMQINVRACRSGFCFPMTQSSVDALLRTQRDQIAVWDPVVRLFHWSLVAAFVVAYVAEDEFLAIHVWAGYAVGGLVILRVIWGLVGPRHARFSDFVFGPVAVFAYLRDMLRFRAKRHLGHSPAGGAMVLALLLTLSVLVGTGLVTYAIRNNAGPLAGIVTAEISLAYPAAGAERSDGASRPAGERVRAPKPGRTWKNVHEFTANLALVLIGLHVLGVIFSSFAHRENLVRAMITGRKPSNVE